MTTTLLTTRLESWHRTAILEHSTAQEFADAFIASGDAEGLEDGFDAIEAACRVMYAEMQSEAVGTHEAQLVEAQSLPASVACDREGRPRPVGREVLAPRRASRDA